MCRSQAEGGRRCSSSGQSASVPVATSGNTSDVPSRERADALAAALPADSKDWKGDRLDDAGRRLYALRDSGYTGPINQDGYPDTTSEGAATLRRMAERRGEDTSWYEGQGGVVTNVATSGYTAIQAGRITGEATEPPAMPETGSVHTINVVSGNATVGRQLP